MPENELDVRDLPAPERHSAILEAFDELESGEELILINDHEPRPLYYQMREEVEDFDEEGYEVEQEGLERFVAKLPKK